MYDIYEIESDQILNIKDKYESLKIEIHIIEGSLDSFKDSIVTLKEMGIDHTKMENILNNTMKELKIKKYEFDNFKDTYAEYFV